MQTDSGTCFQEIRPFCFGTDDKDVLSPKPSVPKPVLSLKRTEKNLENIVTVKKLDMTHLAGSDLRLALPTTEKHSLTKFSKEMCFVIINPIASMEIIWNDVMTESPYPIRYFDWMISTFVSCFRTEKPIIFSAFQEGSSGLLRL
ncbi:hypothetical protein KUTeg_005256 [Tegillarca granosa]|uniref:Uncharacterized protein n=1 Tax=Tegillarca granosa TaxID=220873 RepID=A0ABQ9FN50_TEGGR|nr:hypothetical protein KUTeg_005256 [Tegillarca granosa]